MIVTTPPLVLTVGVTPLSWIDDCPGAVIPPVTGDAPLYNVAWMVNDCALTIAPLEFTTIESI